MVMLHMNNNCEFFERYSSIYQLWLFFIFLNKFCSFFYSSTNSLMNFDIENMEHLGKINIPNHL